MSDNSTNRTYAIFTYNCPSPDVERYKNSPDEISATIGISIPGFVLEIFRYSNTPYAVELRCLNIAANETFVNLVYDINPAPPLLELPCEAMNTCCKISQCSHQIQWNMCVHLEEATLTLDINNCNTFSGRVLCMCVCVLTLQRTVYGWCLYVCLSVCLSVRLCIYRRSGNFRVSIFWSIKFSVHLIFFGRWSNQYFMYCEY